MVFAWSFVAVCRADEGVEFFEKKIRPVLVEHCYQCHSADSPKLQGELRLDFKAGWQLGGESGKPAIVPGKPEESPLIRAIRHENDASAMPPNQSRLSDAIVADLTEWVRRGAPDPRAGTVTSDKASNWEAEFQRRLDWWSLRPVGNHPPPKIASDWPKDSLDQFILQALHEHQLQPAGDVDALTLLRRVSFVLTGLPPTAEMVQSFPARFEHDPDAALADIVDRFLKSPHFGERIARHWMDVVRYTDTYGYEWDNPAKGSWEYRDYLIRAFNNDVSFQQLIREQLAGDLLESPRIDFASGLNESLIGTTFYHMGEHRHGDNEVINGVREEMIDNKIDAFSKAFLAMTIACARCHDHKLDAVSQKDYYAIAGMFMTPRWTSRSIEAPQKNSATIEELRRLRAAIRHRTATLWSQRASELGSGEALRQTAAKLDRAELAKAKLGDIEWVLHRLLPPAGVEGSLSDQATAEVWQQLVTEWRTAHQQRTEANAKFKPLVDFSQPGWPAGFVIEGDGLRTGYVAGGEPLVALDGDIAVERLLPRGYHTHALSSKLSGSLRLPSQDDLPGPFFSIALAGDEWSGYLRIPDNGFQTETVTFLSQRLTTWRVLGDIPFTNGIQRVAYEITTSDLNPNFPPRTGVATVAGKTLPHQDQGFDKRSWFSVTGLVSHDQATPPVDDLARFAPLVADPAPTDSTAAWQRLGSWLAGSVAKLKAGPVNEDDVQLINWLLGQKLLPNQLVDDGELAALVKQYREVEASLPFARACNGMDERHVKPIDYALHVRGDIDRRGDRVPRGLPRFVDFFQPQLPSTGPSDSPRSGRLELADFLADPRHGLAARVYVNRVWQWVFGDGLVRTSNDFGHLGELPSHPELLDTLTREFIADGWSTKRLIRRLVLSRTFRQSGKVVDQAAAADPLNRWMHHYPTRRLEAEAIRDSLLSVSGRLDPQLYGRPIDPTRQVEDASKRLFSGPLDGNGRRSIYLEVSIMDRSKFLQSFNAPDPKLPTGRRDETNVPAQALVMLNDPLVLAMADQWVSRLVADGSASVEDRIRSMFLQALGRPPAADEATRWVALMGSLSPGDRVLTDQTAWKHAAHTLFNLQEFTHYR